jgi:hypothetical protein
VKIDGIWELLRIGVTYCQDIHASRVLVLASGADSGGHFGNFGTDTVISDVHPGRDVSPLLILQVDRIHWRLCAGEDGILLLDIG